MNTATIENLKGQFEVTEPGNGISSAGIELIQQRMVDWGFDRIPDVISVPNSSTVEWRWEWRIGGKGEYVGTLPKRIGKFVWQAAKIKLSKEQLSEIGNIGAAHSGKYVIHNMDIVDHANWEQEDFGQPSGCCFWSCHASAKDMIIDNGGGAIRFFRNDDYNVENGFARAWLAPYRDCWIVFNGYGMETLPIARVLAAHLDHAYYRKVELVNNGDAENTLWINNGTGYLVGPQESVLGWDKIDLKWNDPGVICNFCEEEIDINNRYRSPDGDDCCEKCYHERCFACTHCDDVCWMVDHFLVCDRYYCQDCFSELFDICDDCGEVITRTESYISPDDITYCDECYMNWFSYCDECGNEISIDDLTLTEDGYYCRKCMEEHQKEKKENEVKV